jgi:tetratricopeptide (TPR) repeat protein
LNPFGRTASRPGGRVHLAADQVSSGFSASFRPAILGFRFLKRFVTLERNLKPKKHTPKRQAREAASKAREARRVPEPTPARRWLFGIIAMVLVPLLLLSLLEVALRIAGFGYPTDFFLRTRIQDRDVFVDNAMFGMRFFPPALARSPSPTVLEARKPANTYRIFVLGESAALGDPKPAYGFGRYLEVLLRERFPGVRFEVVCVAMTAINSHAILPIARECARHEGDAWIVYMGNNEMEGPFGAGNVFGSRTPGLSLIRASLALKTTRLGQLLDWAQQRFFAARSQPGAWRGLGMFSESQIPPDAPRRHLVYDHFRRNLEDILEAGENARARIILSTVAGNLKDCPPFASLSSGTLNDLQKTDWSRLYEEGTAAEKAGRRDAAIETFSTAEVIDSRFADLQYRLARNLLAVTNLAEARRHFELARDADALPFRTDSTLNRMIREAAERHKARGVTLLDAENILSRSCTNGIPGEDLFYEHVHFNFDGNYRLALAAADQVLAILPDTMTGKAQGEWASAETCNRRLALTDWNRYQVIETILLRISDAPYTNQLDHLERRRRYLNRLRDLKPRMDPAERKNAKDLYEAVVAQRPDDFMIRQDYAEFLDLTGDLNGAVAQWRQVEQLVPHYPVAWFYAGKLLGRLGRFAEAQPELERAVRIRPDFADAVLELGRALAKQGRIDPALARYQEAQRLNPDNPVLYFSMADAVAQKGDRSRAMEYLREAIRLRPGYWEARYFLGVELAVRNQIQEAQVEFAEVVRLKPDYALGHLNLGVALAKQGKMAEALKAFEQTLKLDPNNPSARKHLDTILSLMERQPK